MEISFSSSLCIHVGSNKSMDICYSLNGVPDKSFKIELKDNSFVVSILVEKSAGYVNHERVINSKIMSYEDVLFSFGLKIFPMYKDNVDYLLANNPSNLVLFNPSMVQVVRFQSDFVEDNKTLNEDTFYRTSRFYKDWKPFTLGIDAPPLKKLNIILLHY